MTHEATTEQGTAESLRYKCCDAATDSHAAVAAW